MRRLALDVGIVAALAVAFLAAFHNLPSHEPYYYDEADYVTAAGKGFAANILEQPSMSIVEFLKIGLNRTAQANRASLSDIVRGAHDITFYRHYHGPVYFYWLAALGPFVHFDEYALRLSGLFWHLMAFSVMYFGVLLLSSSRIAALITSCLFLFGQFNIATDVQLTPHISYVFFTILSLLTFARYIQTGFIRVWYWSVVAFAPAFCSVEYAILLPLAFVITVALYPNRRLSGSVLLRSALIFLLCVLVLWPIGLLEMSALKGYFSISYLAMQRSGVYGDGSPLSVWIHRFYEAPVEFIGIAVGVTALIFSALRRRTSPFLTPFLIYSLLMLMTTLKNRSLNPTYISSILPPLFVIAGIGFTSLIHSAKPVVQILLTASALLLICTNGYQMILRKDTSLNTRPEAGIIASIQANRMESSNILVPSDFLPVISYYYPKMQLHAYLKTDDANTLIEKLRNYNAETIIGVEATLRKKLLIDGIRVGFTSIPSSSGYSIIHVDDNH